MHGLPIGRHARWRDHGHISYVGDIGNVSHDESSRKK